MTSELSFSSRLNTQPSRRGLLIAVLVAASIAAVSFAFGRSALEASERANAIEIANESQSFCAGLGFSPTTEAHRKCVAGLGEIKLHHEQRLLAAAAGLL